MANKAGSLQISLEMQVAALRRDIAAVNTELKRGTDSWQSSISGFASGFKQAFGIAAIGATVAAALGAAQAAVRSLVIEMEGISDGAKKIGVTVEEYQKLQFVFEQTGLTAEAMESAIGRLNKTLGQAQAGVKGSVEAFADLNINVAELSRVGGIEQLARIADELDSIASPAERAAKGAALFGKAYTQLGPLIAEGGEGIRQLAADAERLSLIFGTDAVNAAESLGDNLDVLKRQGVVLLSEFIGPMLIQMNEVTQQTGRATTGVNNFQIVIRIAAAYLNQLGQSLAFIVGVFGAMLRGIGIIIGAFADLVRSVTAAGDAIGQVWQAITNPFGAFTIGDAVANAEARIKDIMSASLRVLASSIAPAQEILKQIVTPAATLPTVAAIDTTEIETAADTVVAANRRVKESIKELTDEVELGGGLADWVDQLKEFAPELDRIKQGYAEQAQNIRDQLDPLTALRMEQEGYDAALQAGLVSLADHSVLTADVLARTQEQVMQNHEQQLAIVNQLVDAGLDIGAAFASSAEQGKQAMRQLVASLLTAIAKAVILQFLMNSINGTQGGYSNAILGALSGTASAFGGVPASAASPATATAFGGVPLTASGSASVGSIATGVPFAATMARQKPMRVEVNNYGAQVGVTQDAETIRIVVEAATARIAGDVSSGGNPVSAAMERTYGLRR